MSASPPKADMCSALAHVCFGPEADISYSITSSASASTVGGTVRPTAFFDYCRPAFRKPWEFLAAGRAYMECSLHTKRWRRWAAIPLCVATPTSTWPACARLSGQLFRSWWIVAPYFQILKSNTEFCCLLCDTCPYLREASPPFSQPYPDE